MKIRRLLVFMSVIVAVVIGLYSGCAEFRRALVDTFSGTYGPVAALPLPPPVYDGKDSLRARIPIRITSVANGVNRPTDIQFDPSRPEVMIVLEQEGAMRWFDLEETRQGLVKRYDVLSVSEQGLLGMAFHPRFPEIPRYYLNMTVRSGNRDVTRIVEVELGPPADLREARIIRERTLLDVEQPYQNHNAGQLVFGPDGYLYIGLGDGGWAGDPHNHGQDLSTLLGSMLRIDVNSSGEKPYGIPPDNPFVDTPGVPPETWAFGLRNPWRYSFDQSGRLIVADVGQNLWEELDILEAGKNYGWRIREGRHCYDPPEDCEKEGLVDPFYEYGHDEGLSVTGGYVYLDDDFPRLQGLYVFGDFQNGRLWALQLPEGNASASEPYTLGRWEMLISTFGRDPKGKVYIAEFGHGVIYRIDPQG
jgi:glucose/arabinose dehydrogenase